MKNRTQADRKLDDSARLRDKHPPIVFVHLGTRLPSHFLPSVRRVSAKYAGEVVALLNRQAIEASNPKGLNIVCIEDFYDPSVFLDSESAKTWGDTFRDGFFLKCLERFFVLDQYMKTIGCSKFFHAESDVITFRLEKLGPALDKEASGLFIPRDHEERAIASLIYCNHPDSLSRLVDFALKTKGFNNEMQLLAKFLSTESSAFALPTVRVWEDSKEASGTTVTIDQAGGLFDAAGLGQWVAGIDPRNTDFPVFNRFQNEMNATNFAELKFRFDRDSNSLRLKRRGDERYIEVFNLHIHSKFVALFTSDFALNALLWASHLPLRLPLEFKAKKWVRMAFKVPATGVAKFARLARRLSGRWLKPRG